VTALGLRFGALLVAACFLLGLLIVVVYRLRWLLRRRKLRLREARDAFRKSVRLRTLTHADLEWKIAEWKIAEGNRPGRLLVAGPFCPRCGRILWGKRGTTWARTTWISVENPCKGCGREARNPDLAWSVQWLQKQVLREAQQRGGAGSERGF